jgi:hypothetical protein
MLWDDKRIVQALRDPVNRPALLGRIARLVAVVVMVVALTAGVSSEVGWWMVVGVVAVGVVLTWLLLRRLV